MNKYKVIYYVVAIALLVSVCLLIGTNLGWFDLYYSDQFIWYTLPSSQSLTGLKRKQTI